MNVDVFDKNYCSNYFHIISIPKTVMLDLDFFIFANKIYYLTLSFQNHGFILFHCIICITDFYHFFKDDII